MKKLKEIYNHPTTQRILLTFCIFYALLRQDVAFSVLLAGFFVAKAITEIKHHTHIHQEFNLKVPKDMNAEGLRGFYDSLKEDNSRAEYTNCPDKLEPKE